MESAVFIERILDVETQITYIFGNHFFGHPPPWQMRKTIFFHGLDIGHMHANGQIDLG